MAAQVAGAAAAAAAGQPLLKGGGGGDDDKNVDCATRCFRWFCSNPLANLPIVLLFVAGIVCIVGAALDWEIAVALVGFVALLLGAQQVFTLRNLAAEVDRFAKENEKLEETADRLTTEVNTLQNTKDKLEGQVDKLENTVTDLKHVSDGLQSELDGFEKLKVNFEKFASETGHDITKVLDNANKIYDKMHNNTVQNERALLGKIAQDLEFMDKDVGMSRDEFLKFIERIPENLKKKYREMGKTFEDIAGDDAVVDFTEVQQLIDQLVSDNKEALESIQVQK